MNNTFALIMAGGVGSRFWPYSREEFPKQFQDILGVGESLLQLTAKRLLDFIPWENQLILTNEKYFDLVVKQLPLLPKENILTEPLRKNTAPCVAYAGYEVFKRNPQAQIITTPADHLILHEKPYLTALKTACEFTAKNSSILTLGIEPSRPDTGYGYIEKDQRIEGSEIFKVKRFTEKPELATAKAFISTGNFVWNAGIFIWSAQTLVDAFAIHCEVLHDIFSKDLPHKDAVYQAFDASPEISIDYAIMEKAENVFTLPVSCGWSDLGTWNSLHDVSAKDEKGNVIDGKVLKYDIEGCIVKTPKDRLVVLQGLKNCIVAEYDNALLVCDRENEQAIKTYLKAAKTEGLEFS